METTHDDHSPDGPASWAAIELRIDQYRRPRDLSPDVAEKVLPRLKELTRLAAPTTPEEAKCLLSAGCRLIADTTESRIGDDVDVDAVLCDAAVASWSHAAERDDMSPGTLANSLRFLNRLVRARKGFPPRATSRRPRAAPPVLLDYELLAALAERLARTDRPASAALVTAAGAGLVASADLVAIGSVTDGAVEAVSAEQRAAITTGWIGLARELAGVVADPPAWARLRTAGTELGVPLTGPALRLRWAVDVVVAAPTPQAAVQSGLTRNLLNQAIGHLPAVDEETARMALRG